MSIAVDQSRLRRIVTHFLPGETLEPVEANTVLEIAQVAAGADRHDDPAEKAMLQAVAQQIGLKPGELRAIPPLPDDESRRAWVTALAKELRSRGARELAYSLAFLLSVADLELVPAESQALEDLQRALGVDHRRATDVVVYLTEVVAS